MPSEAQDIEFSSEFLMVDGEDANGALNGAPYDILESDGQVHYIFHGNLNIPAGSAITFSGPAPIMIEVDNDVTIGEGVTFDVSANGSHGGGAGGNDGGAGAGTQTGGAGGADSTGGAGGLSISYGGPFGPSTAPANGWGGGSGVSNHGVTGSTASGAPGEGNGGPGGLGGTAGSGGSGGLAGTGGRGGFGYFFHHHWRSGRGSDSHPC